MILKTKLLTPPLRKRAVQRLHLFEKLNQGLLEPQHRLTVVNAPAGYGKTTLVALWLARLDWPHAWLSLGRGENDPLQFFTYLLAALQGLHPEWGLSALALLHSLPPPGLQELITTLTNDMVEHPSPGVLVLDDCHVIENEAVHQALSSWLEYLPPGLHLVITSRGNPPLTTHRRRARGMMAEIGFRELRFSQDEARAFLQHTMGLGLDEDAVHSLAERLEGWPAGLQLAALSRPQESAAGEGLAGYPSPLKLLEEYLLPEVFEHEPADVQEFLLATALLEEMTAPLCAAVTGAEPGGGIARPSGSQGILPGMAGR